MGDHGAGYVAAGAISAALYSREQTGKGQVVATSLLRQGLYTLSFDLSICLRFGVAIQAGNRNTMGNPVNNSYQVPVERPYGRLVTNAPSETAAGLNL